MALDHQGFRQLGGGLAKAVKETISSGNTTGDLGGSLGTEAFTDAVCSSLKKILAGS